MVGRLKLSHNQISQVPFKFEHCEVLKYLNLRGNRFKEFPKAVGSTVDTLSFS